MLGTPNHGAYAMVEFLSGQAELMRMLDLLDGRHDLDEICRQFRRYPGLVELLPQGHDEEWREAFLATLSRSEKPNFEKLLTKADEVWQTLNDAVDAEHMCYVAGSASATVGKVEAGEKKTLVFHDSTLGDGFVTTELARLADVPVWTMDAPHGDLANRIDNFGALEDLLSAGKTGAAQQRDSAAGSAGRSHPAPNPLGALSQQARVHRGGHGRRRAECRLRPHLSRP